MAQRQWRSDDTLLWQHKFGGGGDGTSYSVPSNEGCSGTTGTTTLTLAAAGTFADNDLVLIVQNRGTAVFGWELNKIISGGGTTTLTLETNLTQTYTDSGSSQAQVIEMKEYNGLTSGSITAPAWDGSKGGIIGFFDKGATTTIDGTLTLTAKGFVGGVGGSHKPGYRGEGTPAASTQGSTANGSGGGGGGDGGGSNNGGGAGGGYAATGGTGSAIAGIGGTAVGNASLTQIAFGGAGGSGSSGTSTGAGGNSGGIAFIFCKNLVITGGIANNGNPGTAGSYEYGGGGGSGGAVLIKCQTATLGTNLITATGGSGGTGSLGNGGTGSVGRIHIDYSISYTGTTNPTIDATLDSTITESPSSMFLMF